MKHKKKSRKKLEPDLSQLLSGHHRGIVAALALVRGIAKPTNSGSPEEQREDQTGGVCMCMCTIKYASCVHIYMHLLSDARHSTNIPVRVSCSGSALTGIITSRACTYPHTFMYMHLSIPHK